VRSLTFSLCILWTGCCFGIEGENSLGGSSSRYGILEEKLHVLEIQCQNQQHALDLVCAYIRQLDKYFNEMEGHIGNLTAKVESKQAQNENMIDSFSGVHSLINKIESSLTKLDKQKSFEIGSVQAELSALQWRMRELEGFLPSLTSFTNKGNRLGHYGLRIPLNTY
jgi:chromosome segregation ATPase